MASPTEESKTKITTTTETDSKSVVAVPVPALGDVQTLESVIRLFVTGIANDVCISRGTLLGTETLWRAPEATGKEIDKRDSAFDAAHLFYLAPLLEDAPLTLRERLVDAKSYPTPRLNNYFAVLLAGLGLLNWVIASLLSRKSGGRIKHDGSFVARIAVRNVRATQQFESGSPATERVLVHPEPAVFPWRKQATDTVPTEWLERLYTTKHQVCLITLEDGRELALDLVAPVYNVLRFDIKDMIFPVTLMPMSEAPHIVQDTKLPLDIYPAFWRAVQLKRYAEEAKAGSDRAMDLDHFILMAMETKFKADLNPPIPVKFAEVIEEVEAPQPVLVSSSGQT